MKKKILLVSFGMPNYGGASTTMFNLKKLLDNDFETKLVYFNNGSLLKDSRNITDDILEIDRNKSISRKIYNFLLRIYKLGKLIFMKFKYKKYSIDSMINRNQMLPMISLIDFIDLKKMLFKKRFFPDIIVSNLPTYFDVLNRIGVKRKILIVNGSYEMNELANNNTDANCFFYKPEVLNSKQKITYKFSKLQVVFNSPLTKKIYEKMNVSMPNAIVRHFNLNPISTVKNKAFHDRTYDFAYFVSDTSRKIKNPELAIRLFEEFPELNKICVGMGSSIFNDIKNSTTKELITQQEVFEKMNDVRLVIIPSFYDSSPGIMTEAITRGCNVLISKNIGWNEYMDQECVVNNFSDLNEWVEKLTHLTKHYKANDKFTKLISQSPSEILSFFKNIQD